MDEKNTGTLDGRLEMLACEYILVYNLPILVIVRIPLKPRPLWRSILKALMPICREQGQRQKDLHTDVWSLETLAPRLALAYAGDMTILPKFRLYDWNAETASFTLTRRENLDLSPVVMTTYHTLDKTQQKSLLGYPGQARFLVTCKDIGTDIEEQTIYDGPDLDEAIRIYNSLS